MWGDSERKCCTSAVECIVDQTACSRRRLSLPTVCCCAALLYACRRPSKQWRYSFRLPANPNAFPTIPMPSGGDPATRQKGRPGCRRTRPPRPLRRAQEAVGVRQGEDEVGEKKGTVNIRGRNCCFVHIYFEVEVHDELVLSLAELGSIAAELGLVGGCLRHWNQVLVKIECRPPPQSLFFFFFASRRVVLPLVGRLAPMVARGTCEPTAFGVYNVDTTTSLVSLPIALPKPLRRGAEYRTEWPLSTAACLPSPRKPPLRKPESTCSLEPVSR